jgi:hypothetical protein
MQSFLFDGFFYGVALLGIYWFFSVPAADIGEMSFIPLNGVTAIGLLETCVFTCFRKLLNIPRGAFFVKKKIHPGIL